jgi:hypothetical protein
MVADHWIEGMETYFEMIECTEIEKRKIATFFLKGDALDWWKSMRQTVDVSTFTWGDFTPIFQEKYFPASVQEDLELEFLALVQGDMTIREYDARFSQLYRYVRPMGATALAQKYLRGLRQEYKTMISVLCLTTREQIFESAMSLEQAEKTRAGDVGNRDAKGKGKAVYTGSEH